VKVDGGGKKKRGRGENWENKSYLSPIREEKINRIALLQIKWED